MLSHLKPKRVGIFLGGGVLGGLEKFQTFLFFWKASLRRVYFMKYSDMFYNPEFNN